MKNNAAGEQKQTRGRYIWMRLKKSKELYLLLLPAVVLLILFSYLPMYGVLMAFQDFNASKGIWGSEWIGLSNFIEYFQSWQFGRTLKNTLVINLLSIAIQFPLPIMLALLCNQMKGARFKKFFQVSTYLPHFISTVVMCGMIILFTSPTRGIIAHLLDYIGVEFPNVMGSTAAFPWLYVLTGVWQNLGWDSILYVASLSAVDPTYYEAATLDGASKWQKIRYIDLPSLTPTICIQFILRCGSILGVGYEKVLLLQNNMNLPASEVISTYVYKLGIQSNQFGQSAAIGLFNTLVGLILLLIVNKICDKLQDTSLL